MGQRGHQCDCRGLLLRLRREVRHRAQPPRLERGCKPGNCNFDRLPATTLLTYGAARSKEAVSFDGSTVHTVVADRSSNATPDVNHNDEWVSLLLRSALQLRTRSALEGRPRCPLPFSGYSLTRLSVMSRVPLLYVFMSTVGLFMAHYAHALRYSSLHLDRLPESLASK